MGKVMISGHGGRYSSTKKIKVPKGINVHFFCLDGEELTNRWSVAVNGWAIYNHLKGGSHLPGNQTFLNTSIKETIKEETEVYDYECWAMTDQADGKGAAQASGIFSDAVSVPLTATSEKLSAILAKCSSPSDVYWVACRSIG